MQTLESSAGSQELVTVIRDKTPGLRNTAAAVGKFLLHFLEMVIAMMAGMAIFAPVKLALVSQGYIALADRSSLEYQLWMNLFMVAPMVLWMRLRGCSWREGAEMAAAMVVPTACVLLLCRLGMTAVFPWITPGLSGPAMFIGMLALMLYRREMYTTGYSIAWIRKFRTAPTNVRESTTPPHHFR